MTIVISEEMRLQICTILALLLAMSIHEGGHYLAAVLCGVRVTGMRMGLLGLRMRLSGVLSYRHECLIAGAGPLFSFLLAWMLSYAPESEAYSLIPTLQGVSWGLGIINLSPVESLDGGRMLRAVISRFLSPIVADRVLRVTTAVTLILLWLTATYALMKNSPAVSAFLFSSTLILRYMSKAEREL